MKGFKKVLIAVNGSTSLLKQGLKLAGDEGCWVTVVKVFPPYEGDLNLVGIKNIREVLTGEGQKAVEEINSTANAESTLVKTRLEAGKIHEKIIEVAEEECCDIIVMGRKVKNGIRKYFGGSILNKVMKYAPCPVLVVDA